MSVLRGVGPARASGPCGRSMTKNHLSDVDDLGRGRRHGRMMGFIRNPDFRKLLPLTRLQARLVIHSWACEDGMAALFAKKPYMTGFCESKQQRSGLNTRINLSPMPARSTAKRSVHTPKKDPNSEGIAASLLWKDRGVGKEATTWVHIEACYWLTKNHFLIPLLLQVNSPLFRNFDDGSCARSG